MSLQSDLTQLLADVHRSWVPDRRGPRLLTLMVQRTDPRGPARPYDDTSRAAHLRNRAMQEALGFNITGYGENGMYTWNDAYGRTKAEVIARVEQALAEVTPEPVNTIQELMTTARDLALTSLAYA